jgi:uroporphyrinogen III methyltransferase/synthase
MPEAYVAEALAAAIQAADTLTGKRILLLRADIARKDLTQLLTDAGARCDDVTAYRTIRPAALPDEVISRLDRGAVHWVTFTSGSTVDNFLALIGETRRARLATVKLASIGPITSERLRSAGLHPNVEADPYTTEGLAEAIARYAIAERESA